MRRKHERRKDFFPGVWPLAASPRGSHKDFSRGSKVVKFNFSFLKLRKRPLFAEHVTEKRQISKSRGTKGPHNPFPTPMDVSNAHCRQQQLDNTSFPHG